MNISKQLKNYRREFNISQEDLSEIVHVSRQTISNWENNKSYPDLQSLILLSEHFKISLDELVKGDVVSMKNELQRNEMNKYAKGMMIGWILMILSVPLTKIFNPYGFIVTVISAGVMIWSAFKVEKIKKDADIKTYQEIVAYMENREMPTYENRRKNKFLETTLLVIGSVVITLVAILLLMKFV